MKKQPDRSEFRWILVVATALMIFFLIMFVIPEEQAPVYYKPAGAPNSIPCSSSTNSRCMEYYPL